MTQSGLWSLLLEPFGIDDRALEIAITLHKIQSALLLSWHCEPRSHSSLKPRCCAFIQPFALETASCNPSTTVKRQNSNTRLESFIASPAGEMHTLLLSQAWRSERDGDRKRRKDHHSCAIKGFAISSEPSTGLNSVMVGPRRTTNPSERV